MKKLILLAAFAPLFFVSCGGSDEDTKETTEVVDDSNALDFADMEEISLKPDGLDLKLMLPSVASPTGNSIDPLVIHEDGDYLWYLTIGQRFELVIEDFGKEKMKVAQEKERLAELSEIFKVEFLTDEPNLIMYKRTLQDGQGGKTSYHCYGEIDIKGYNYVLRSEEEGSLKPIIEDMVMTIRSASVIKEA